MKKAVLWLLALFLCVPASAQQRTVSPSVLRALLIGSDRFVTQDSLEPSAINNVRTMRQLLFSDERTYEHVATSVNEPLDEESFKDLVKKAFRGSTGNDISLFYISTHGDYSDEVEGFFRLLLSDGQQEYVLTMKTLYETLKPIQGTKVLIIDACNSGMLLGKGAELDYFVSPFIEDGFKVLTSSGGKELSYNWSSRQDARFGGSYFLLSLAGGLGYQGNFAADANHDGSITMNETYQYLLGNYGPSTPQVYPQQDQFVLMQYSSNIISSNRRLITDVHFENTTLSGGEREISFAYTLNRRARLAYQLVYEHSGAWQFDQPQLIGENETSTGMTLPGRKQRSLTLQQSSEEAYGHVLFFIMAIDEDRAIPLYTSLLSVQSGEEQSLSVSTGKSFSPEKGEELPILFTHEKPCTYTVMIRNAQGDLVATPILDQASRPQHLQPSASVVYWDGRDDMGETVLMGEYTVQVQIVSDNRTSVAFSNLFTVE